jgi:hypothetical protein
MHPITDGSLAIEDQFNDDDSFDSQSGEPSLRQQFEEGEFLTMQKGTADLLNFGQGGGGLYGQDRDVTLNNWRALEHGFQTTDRNTKTVTAEYPPQCMVAVDIYADRLDTDPDDFPQFVTQYYPVGQLPLDRLRELGWDSKMPPADLQRRIADAGGYLPSTDGETEAAEGGFITLRNKENIWQNSPYAQLFEELKQQGLLEHAERVYARGLSALNGTRAHLGTKALPKSKKQQQDEKLTGQQKQERTILVPTQIYKWGWETETASAPAATTAPATKAAKPAPAASKVPAPATSAPAAQSPAASSASNNGAAIDEKIVSFITELLAKHDGMIEKKDLGTALLPYLSKEGTNRPFMMKRANADEFLSGLSDKGIVYDPASGIIMAQA